MNRFATSPPIPASHARERRDRLIERTSGARLDGVLLTDPRDITYFTGFPLSPPLHAPACLLIRASGESTLVCPETEVKHAVDQVFSYPWHIGGTIPTELMPKLIHLAVSRFRLAGARVGVQRESVSAQLLANLSLGASEPVDRIVFDLERTKDALDLFRIRAAIRANLAAFSSIANAITPGATELEVFAAGARGAMLAAGEKVVHDGDYQCGTPGGPCRDRAISAGQIYTIDAWTQVAGYWSDLARAFPVGTPTGEQFRLINHVNSVHSQIQPLLRPGVSGNEIWTAMDSALRTVPSVQGLSHHGGHGLGLRLHEAPDINPGITDILRPGDVICIEPGAYLPYANIRIEETYLITADGAECLSSSMPE
ncbi:MAG: aminopeptidase P family protein [Phycisphaeraceae bacterium]|nr:aminopeptidase P family protein [Phycisphaeraceae bacterium]